MDTAEAFNKPERPEVFNKVAVVDVAVAAVTEADAVDVRIVAERPLLTMSPTDGDMEGQRRRRTPPTHTKFTTTGMFVTRVDSMSRTPTILRRAISIGANQPTT